MTKKILQVNNFAKAGLNTDLMPWDLPADNLTEIRNVRILNEKLTPFGGSVLWATLPIGFKPGYIMSVASTSGEYWLIAGLDSILTYDGTSFSDISNPAGYAGVLNEDYWTGCLITNIPIIVNSGHYPEYWPQQTPGITMEYLPWDATRNWEEAEEFCQIIRSHKQYLFAMILQSGPDEIVDGVRWSSPADVSGVPDTWDHLDSTNVAGLVKLGGQGGKIVDGLSLRDAFCVYREKGVSIFDYVGGQFVWRVRHLSSTFGLIAKDCIVELKGNHYFISDGDILVNDGNKIESLLHKRIKTRFKSDFSAESYKNAYAIKNNSASEIWFCIPETGSTYANLAYVYNYRDDSWTIRDIPAAVFANYGSVSTPSITWDASTEPWDSNLSTWSENQTSPFDDTIIAVVKPTQVEVGGKLLLLDTEISIDTTPYDAVIERVGFALEGLNNVTTITRVYPNMTGPESALIEVGSQDYPGSPIRWKPGVEFTPGVDRKVDIRTTGELHCFRISTNNVNSTWSISGIDIEYSMAGER